MSGPHAWKNSAVIDTQMSMGNPAVLFYYTEISTILLIFIERSSHYYNNDRLSLIY